MERQEKNIIFSETYTLLEKMKLPKLALGTWLMGKNEGVTEQLKSDDWLCWLQKINSIRRRIM